jgi:hypothetical protein
VIACMQINSVTHPCESAATAASVATSAAVVLLGLAKCDTYLFSINYICPQHHVLRPCDFAFWKARPVSTTHAGADSVAGFSHDFSAKQRRFVRLIATIVQRCVRPRATIGGEVATHVPRRCARCSMKPPMVQRSFLSGVARPRIGTWDMRVSGLGMHVFATYFVVHKLVPQDCP